MGRPHGAQEGQRQRVCRLKARARQLLAEGKSIRQIAAELGLSRSTAHRYATSTPGSAPPPPPKGNQRATSHGVFSENVIGALQAKYREKAEARWPHLSVDDTETWARLAARVEQAASFEATAGAITGDRVHGVSTSLTQWEERLRRLTFGARPGGGAQGRGGRAARGAGAE